MIAERQNIEIAILHIRDAGGSAAEYKLRAESGVFVGKSSNCGLQLRDRSLNDIHCRIGLENGHLWVQDWMSAEGTLLNGKAIDSQSFVQWGDVIQIGKSEITASIGNTPAETVHQEADVVEDESFIATELEESLDAEAVEESDFDHRETEEDRLVSAPDDETNSHFNFSFSFEEEETYDRETVALLRAEIEELQTSLRQQDSQSSFERAHDPMTVRNADVAGDQTDAVLERMQELIDEANRSDERVAILEELLHAAEDTSRAEQDERTQLEAWVGDIENRVGQREDEHAAEIEALRARLEESQLAQNRLQRQLQDAAFSGSAPKQYELTLENLQNSNRQLQEQVSQSEKQCLVLEKRLEELSSEQERALREERTKISQEQAKLARMRFELSKKLTDVEELPKATASADKETTHRIQALRDHLREIHEQEKQEEKQTTLATRLTRLWKRMETGQNG